ncbi:MAG TPA: TolC family protein [Gemmatimonadaceae bacterium]|nr:TolC family protein [Gemmatimonadaceae bacterium]
MSFRHSFILALSVAVAAPFAASAQQARSLSLEEALRLAESQSDAIRIARAGVTRARGQELQAFSAYLPQVGASLEYTRTLASQFEAFSSGGAPQPPPGTPPPPNDTTTYFTPCSRYLAPAGASDVERLRALEVAARCAAAGGGGFGNIDFESVGFGARNQYTLGIQGSVDLFTGGRAQAQNRAAGASKRAADIELTSQRALLALNVTEAYFDASLADRLVAIAESSLAWTERAFRQTTLARQVGNTSEFDLLRAQVTRDNQRPALIQRRWERELAYLRLKQLLNIPFEASVTLTTLVDGETGLSAVRTVAAVTGGAVAASAAPDTSTGNRAPVRQLNEALRAQEAQLDVTRSQQWPTLSVSTQYARLNFARGAPKFDNLLTNWNVTVRASMPLFTGGRIRGESMISRAAVQESEARLDQTRKLAALDARQSLAQLEQAEATLSANQGTTEQALKAYRIAEVRFSEGISTQLELSESRLLLEQAQANRALAARNAQVARVRVALLRDLPLGAIGGPFGAPAPSPGPAPAGGGGGFAPGGIQQRPTRPPQTAATSVGSGQ